MPEKSKKGREYFETDFLSYLIKHQVLKPEQVQMVKGLLSGDKDLENILLDYLSLDDVLKHKSLHLGIERFCLSEKSIDMKAVLRISEELARKYILIPVAIRENRLSVAMADPANGSALDDIRLYSGCQVDPLLAGKEEIKIAIRDCFTIGRSGAEFSGQNSGPFSKWKVDGGLKDGQEAPVIQLVDSLISQAIMEKASDIHWEPKEDFFQVRFRIDGKLEIKTVAPSGLAKGITARLKVMGGMDVTERRIPQDGRIILDHPGKRIDIRVSTFTTVCGEKVVTRILDEQTARRSLEELGMRQEVEEGVRRLLRQPHGLILVSGPTGSGKTTTLYALLQELSSGSLNIVSIEDPVEYRIPGVNQAQVNARAGFDFAGGLRAVLRQDPDIIMVGEIRDKETARIATAAALTGHLVLSTVHTNTAAEAVARMLDMEIEPYLVASSVCGVIAQRLVRKLCPHCRKQVPVSSEVKKALRWDNVFTIFEPEGCAKCRGTGYSGRLGVHEYLPYHQPIKELIMQKSDAAAIEKTACSLGMLTLWQDALQKVVRGTTSLEEVMGLLAGL
ncbi:MAG: Type II secretion system protein E [Candidatus Dichloromethanomonas elyunquensis]|nr:MAG: Type II secretion system protein E [Candidatus Dichloromethanomonas elyunquensis]